MRLRFVPLLRLAGLLLAAAARAQPATPDSTLDAVTVTAARVPVTTAEAPARVTVLDRDALDAAGSTSLADALEARAPVHVRRYGPSGLATATVRGATASQTLVLLDGLPLTDPQLGQVDLSLLPTALVEAVEVLSGPAAGLYGSAGLGGVVHLRPPRAEATAARATATAGPWGERRASTLLTATAGSLRALVAAEAAQDDGDYTFRDASRLDAPRVAREGWDTNHASLYTALAVEHERQRAGLSLWAADAERGLGGDADAGERQWDRRLRLGATASRTTRGGLQIEGAAVLQRARLRYANPFPSTRADALDETGRTTAAHADLRVTTDVGGWAWTGALTGGLSRGEHPSLVAAAADRTVGAALSGRGTLGRVRLFPALRADLYASAGRDRQLAVSPQLGANVTLASGWRLKSSVAHAFRMPTLNDRFWQPGGNPDLRPERAISVDGGLVWSARGAHVEATLYAATARDQIVWSPTPAGFWAPANVARTRSLGAEASGQVARVVRLGAWPALAEAGALATLTDARDLDTGFALRYVPRWTVKGWAALRLGAVRLDVNARAVGSRYTTASESLPVSAYLVVDGAASVRWRHSETDLTLAFRAENLTGAQYEVVRSYPMPPRHARLHLSLSL